MITLDQLQAIMPRLPAEKAAEYLPHLNRAMEEFGITEANRCPGCGREGAPPADGFAHQRFYKHGALVCERRRYEHPARMAAFLAQLAHESGELTRWEEAPWVEYRCACGWKGRQLPDPAVHSATGHEVRTVKHPDCGDNRNDLGNTQPGDGVRFKGRGPIMLTGRANYRAASLVLFPGEPGHDGTQTYLELRPEEALRPDTAFRVAGWLWATRHTQAHKETGKPVTLNDVADRVDVEIRDCERPRDAPPCRVARVLFDEITHALNGDGADERWAYYLRAREVLASPAEATR